MERSITASRSLLDLHESYGVERTLRDDEIAFFRRHHVSYDSATGRNRPRLELRSFRIEANHRVWTDSRFYIPDRALRERDGVGKRTSAAWRRPFLHLACRWVEHSEVSARVVGVPDHVV